MKLQEKSFWNNIKSEQFLPVYLVTGTENYLKQKYIKLLTDRAVPEGLRGFNYHRLDGDTMTMEQLVNAAEALPAMSPRTCVLVHDLDFAALKEGDKEVLLNLLEDPSETCVLIFWQDTKGFPRNTKMMKNLYKAFDKAGAVVELNKRDRRDLVKFIRSECRKRDRVISSQAAEYLIESVGEDMTKLTSEIEKLCNYADQEITRKDIDDICIKTLEATAFQMIDALMAENYDRVFRSIAILFEQRTEPMMILGALVSTYSDMYRVKVAVKSGGTPYDLKKLFPQAYKSEFKLKNAARRSKKFSLQALRQSLEILADADTKLKSTSEDTRTVFEKLMIELGLARKRTA